MVTNDKPKIVQDMLDSMGNGTVMKATVSIIGGDASTVYTINMRTMTPREKEKLYNDGYR